MNPIINLGFISIHLYSICLMIAVIIGYNLIVKESVRHGFDFEEASNMMFYAIIFGIIGARIYYVLFNLDYYLTSPLSVFKVWEGGLAIHGGIIAGFLTILYFCKKKKYNLLLVLDFIVVGLIIAQAIGRWGNFFNGEAHGPITTLSYLKSLYLPRFIIKGMYIDGNYYIPTFLYESLWCLLGFIIMYLVRNKKFVKVGYITSFYFIWYGIERFFVESLRTDSLMFLNLKVAQLVSLFMIIIGIFIFVYCFKKSNIYKEEKYD
ncbi:MAG: prolipoprotein diacylglyceryl transferase [Bacilli bacterium]|nr:prolipoprotein diacylglyceryl transferase [Bacilli bacterium]